MRSQQHISRVAPPPNREKFIVLMVSGWLITGTVGIILSWAFGDSLLGDSLGWLMGGAMGGLITGYALTQIAPDIQRKQVTIITVGWAINLAFFEILTGAISNVFGAPLSWALGWAIAGAVGGWITGYALTQVDPRIQRQQRVIMTLGFAAGWAIGGTIAGALGEAFSWAIGWLIAGTANGSVILWCLRKPNFIKA